MRRPVWKAAPNVLRIARCAASQGRHISPDGFVQVTDCTMSLIPNIFVRLDVETVANHSVCPGDFRGMTSDNQYSTLDRLHVVVH